MGAYVHIEMNMTLDEKFKEDNPKIFAFLDFMHKAINEDPQDLLEIPFTGDEWLDSEWREVFEDVFNSSTDFDSIIRSVGELSTDEKLFEFKENEVGNFVFKAKSGFKYRNNRTVEMQQWTDIFKPYILDNDICGLYVAEDGYKLFFTKALGWHFCDDMKFDRSYETWYLEKYNHNNVTPHVFTKD